MQFICVSNPLIFSTLQTSFYGRHVLFMAFSDDDEKNYSL